MSDDQAAGHDDDGGRGAWTMSLDLVYRCDACPTTVTHVAGDRGALLTPSGWVVLGTWDTGFLHGCSTECAALIAETRGVRPVERAATQRDGED